MIQLSSDTLSILQNFQQINPSILICPGNSLRTVSVSEAVFAEATIPDSFEQEFAIYDLAKFLGVLSMDKNPSKLEFYDQYMIIHQKHGKTKFFFCSPDMVKHVKKNPLPINDPVVKFELSSEIFQQLTMSMKILGFQEIAICGESGVLSINTMDVIAEKKGKDFSNKFSVNIGETDKTFTAVIDAERLKFIPSNYTVTVSKRMGCAHFKTTLPNGNVLQYWVVLTGTKTDFSNV